LRQRNYGLRGSDQVKVETDRGVKGWKEWSNYVTGWRHRLSLKAAKKCKKIFKKSKKTPPGRFTNVIAKYYLRIFNVQIRTSKIAASIYTQEF
jgi:hypothetical protein